MGEIYTPEAMLAKLVAFPTVSRDGNLELIDFVRDYLAGWGVPATVVPYEPGKAQLYAQIGPDAPGGVVLSAHTDVVPVEGQAWSSDPWTLSERGGRLYGRGSADMKGFAALGLALIPEMLGAGLKRPIQIALSADEEIGCRGAPPLIEAMRGALPMASAVIVGEPTSLGVVTAHKAGIPLITRLTGYEVHSSLVHTGVSAIMAAAPLIQWHTDRMAEERAKADPDSLFDPGWTTLHVGIIHGGTARNITAKECVMQSEIRALPGEDAAAWIARYRAFCAELERGMKAVRPEAGIEVEAGWVVPACAPEPGGAAETLARRLTGDNAPRAVSYGTEAGQFQAAGYSAVVCGPGSIEQAHQADEFIEVAQLHAGAAFMRRLIADLAA
jgi:acetylornithine deacetylase